MRFPFQLPRSISSLAILSALSLSTYLLVSHSTLRNGFPLDDAWIHQTYARNLVVHGEWAFLPGQVSAGSTAPLWSGILAIGHWLRLGPYVWTYLVGWGMLWLISGLGIYVFRAICPTRVALAPWAGVLLAFEWHLVWAAGSGMETLLFALLVLLVLTWLVAGWRSWWGLGLLIGLSVWVRPGGITLLGPSVLVLLLSETTWRYRVRAGAWLGLGFVTLFVPYLLFNYALSESWWPNTFYAKQAEYAVLRQAPLWSRIAGQLQLLLVGVGSMLLPGVLIFLRDTFRKHAWGVIAGMFWAAGYLGIYAWRLPVTYQHGRYLIPVMPIYFLWGLAGMVTWVKPVSPILWRRVLGRVWIGSTGLVLLIYWILGVRAYSHDVAFIESEMVVAAQWIAENTEPDALVAAHDIGALGYFSERQLLDLAGLVSPQVIPFIRDESRLKDFLDAQGADYLVTFPGWYPALVSDYHPIFQTGGVFSPAQGGENMIVLGWRSAP